MSNISSATPRTPPSSPPGKQFSPGLSGDAPAVLHGINKLLPAIYGFQESLRALQGTAKYVADMMINFPPETHEERIQVEEALGQVLDELALAQGETNPPNMGVWIRLLDSITRGVVRHLDEGLLSPGAKEARRVAFVGALNSSADLVLLSPIQVDPTPEEIIDDMVDDELAHFKLAPITLQFDADDNSRSSF